MSAAAAAQGSAECGQLTAASYLCRQRMPLLSAAALSLHRLPGPHAPRFCRLSISAEFGVASLSANA